MAYELRDGESWAEGYPQDQKISEDEMTQLRARHAAVVEAQKKARLMFQQAVEAGQDLVEQAMSEEHKMMEEIGTRVAGKTTDEIHSQGVFMIVNRSDGSIGFVFSEALKAQAEELAAELAESPDEEHAREVAADLAEEGADSEGGLPN